MAYNDFTVHAVGAFLSLQKKQTNKQTNKYTYKKIQVILFHCIIKTKRKKKLSNKKIKYFKEPGKKKRGKVCIRVKWPIRRELIPVSVA